MAEFLQN